MTRCSDLYTCEDCKSNPACGWCNDVSNTGLGKCVRGSATGPVTKNNVTGKYEVDDDICPNERWHFIECPCKCVPNSIGSVDMLVNVSTKKLGTNFPTIVE